MVNRKNRSKKIKVEYIPNKPADNQIENDVLITQLMITAAKVGIRDLKSNDCVIIEDEVNNDERK